MIPDNRSLTGPLDHDPMTPEARKRQLEYDADKARMQIRMARDQQTNYVNEDIPRKEPWQIDTLESSVELLVDRVWGIEQLISYLWETLGIHIEAPWVEKEELVKKSRIEMATDWVIWNANRLNNAAKRLEKIITQL